LRREVCVGLLKITASSLISDRCLTFFAASSSSS
jgi:hypothetical protein